MCYLSKNNILVCDFCKFLSLVANQNRPVSRKSQPLDPSAPRMQATLATICAAHKLRIVTMDHPPKPSRSESLIRQETDEVTRPERLSKRKAMSEMKLHQGRARSGREIKGPTEIAVLTRASDGIECHGVIPVRLPAVDADRSRPGNLKAHLGEGRPPGS